MTRDPEIVFGLETSAGHSRAALSASYTARVVDAARSHPRRLQASEHGAYRGLDGVLWLPSRLRLTPKTTELLADPGDGDGVRPQSADHPWPRRRAA